MSNMEIKVTSPLTKQQLLIPRVLCIGGKEGEPNDTKGIWITGEIYTYKKHESDGYECYINDANTLAMPVNYPDKFPHLFKPLPWWYGRTVDEMPEYVKNSDIFSMSNGKVYKVIKHEENFVYLEARNNPRFHIENFEPADESDYQEYQKQKEAK